MGTLAAGAGLFGFAFSPFDVFDAAARGLPGNLITAGIDTLVRVLGTLGFDVRRTAKLAEQTIAVCGFWVALSLLAVLFFAVWRSWHRAVVAGALWGGVLGVVLAALSSRFGFAAAPPALNALWLVASLLVWGALLGYAQARLLGGTLQDVEVARLDRRRFFIKLGSTAASVTVVGAVVGRLAAGRGAGESTEAAGETVQLPERGGPQPAPGTRPELTPVAEHYRIDIDTRVPQIRSEDWRLHITGEVARTLALDIETLRALPRRHQFITLSCISNPIAGPLIDTTLWAGVSLMRVLEQAQPTADARFAYMTAVDGFYECIDLDLVRADPRIMLAYAWNRRPLTAEHGFPLRVHIPNRYGMKQPKWLTGIELISEKRQGYWVERGWDELARVRATSVIDTVAADAAYVRDGTRVVPVGGIAYAGDRGISRVELRWDDGPWQLALLLPPLSQETWVLWRSDIPLAQGRHRLTVRCTDGDGRPQTEEVHPPHPSGATGLHHRVVQL